MVHGGVYGIGCPCRGLYIRHDLECNGTIALHWCTGTSHGVGVSA